MVSHVSLVLTIRAAGIYSRNVAACGTAPSSSQVRTPAFQAGNTGSNPVGVTSRHFTEVGGKRETSMVASPSSSGYDAGPFVGSIPHAVVRCTVRMPFASALLGPAVVLAIAAVARADDQAQARKIIDKAIEAMGGEEILAKHEAVTFKDKGTYHGMGEGIPYAGSYALQGSDQFKMEIEGVFAIVVNGDEGWVKAADQTTAMTEEQLADQKEELYAGWVTSLLPLKDKAFQLSPLDEVAVDDRAAVGVKVSREGHRDVKLYFDKESGVLVKSEGTVKSQELGGKEVLQETFYKAYQDVEGAKVVSKMLVHRDGKLFLESEMFDYKAAGKLDDAVFAKP
jgi:hypothetical protein